MPDAEQPPAAIARKRSKIPLVLGVVGAVALGGGGFYVTWSGLLFSPGEAHPSPEAKVAALPDVQFVALTPLVVSLGPGAQGNHLRFAAQLEVNGPHAPEVSHLAPRILDVLNGYLRAVDMADLQDPAGLVRLRAQMLRRIQIVTGEGRVRDLLVTEFVLN